MLEMGQSFDGNLTGTAVQADNINIDETNTDGSFQVTFSLTTMQDITDSILILIMVTLYTIWHIFIIWIESDICNEFPRSYIL